MFLDSLTLKTVIRSIVSAKEHLHLFRFQKYLQSKKAFKCDILQENSSGLKILSLFDESHLLINISPVNRRELTIRLLKIESLVIEIDFSSLQSLPLISLIRTCSSILKF